MIRYLVVAGMAVTLGQAGAARADATDAQIAAVIDEGLNRSQVMVSASELMDGIGPRLTNSEGHRRAEDWAAAKFASYGLRNVHREPFEFGRGWNLDSHRARMIEPRVADMVSIPQAWSPPTAGVVRAPVVVAPMSKVEHFEKWRGKLSGKLVLVSMPGRSSEATSGPFKRLTDQEIREQDKYDLPYHDPANMSRRLKSNRFQLELSRFLQAEGAAGMARISYRDGRLVHGAAYLYRPGKTLAVPAVELSAEDYRRLVRLAQAGRPPVVELEIAARFDDADTQADNLFAEIPGSDGGAGYVMAGAHLDSWIAADGASDNGAGTVVVMEAARILTRLGVRPRRTIRFALWSGEEQGLLGSRAYVERHLATRPGGTDPDSEQAWGDAFPISPRPGYADMKAYFNLDNGSGKIRGIHAENNLAAVPTLKKWLAPFVAMGAGTVVTEKTGGTDHVVMQAIGLPGYQFIQDPLDYGNRVHHSSIDMVDHMRGDDLRQAATIMAAMLLQAAMSDTTLPRSPLPTQPAPTDPFRVADPDE